MTTSLRHRTHRYSRPDSHGTSRFRKRLDRYCRVVDTARRIFHRQLTRSRRLHRCDPGLEPLLFLPRSRAIVGQQLIAWSWSVCTRSHRAPGSMPSGSQLRPRSAPWTLPSLAQWTASRRPHQAQVLTRILSHLGIRLRPRSADPDLSLPSQVPAPDIPPPPDGTTKMLDLSDQNRQLRSEQRALPLVRYTANLRSITLITSRVPHQNPALFAHPPTQPRPRCPECFEKMLAAQRRE